MHSTRRVRSAFAQIASVGLMGLISTVLLHNWNTLLETVGTGSILAALLFVVVSFVFGYVVGPSATTKPVLALGTAQRNVAAGMVVATSSFAADPKVLVMVLVVNVVLMALLLPGAGEMGKRRVAAQTAASPLAAAR